MSSRTLTLTSILSIGALALVACGAEERGAGAPAPTTPSSSPTTATPTPTPSPTPTPTPTKPAPPKAKPPADGTNLRACADRTCEVYVKTGDTIRFAAKWEIRQFTVTSVANRELSFVSMDTQPSPLRGTVAGSGNVETADVHIDITPFGLKRAILKFRPR